MNGWEYTESLVDKHINQGGLFVRLTNNHDKIIGAFCGAPYAREVVWTGDRYETYDPSVHRDKRPSLRVMMNFYASEESDMKVIEGGAAWFRDLVKVREKYGLEKWLFEVERLGEARDPKTKYTILPEEKIDEATQARIEALGLHDLAGLAGDEEEAGAGTGAEAVAEAAEPKPGASEAMEALMIRLKRLSRPDIERFLGDLRVRRVRDIGAEDLPRAFARLEELEQLGAGATPDPFDPFA